MFRRTVLLLVVAALPCLAGCFFGMVYPTFSTCPGTTLDPTPDEVVAVRVDVRRVGKVMVPYEAEYHTAARLALPEGRLPRQSRLGAFTSWFAVWGSAGGESNHRSVMVKLYRRGYETVVIRPGDEVEAVEWQPVTSPKEQIRAVRDFAYVARIPQTGTGFRTNVRLSPGSASPKHKEVLLFIASEFDHLAGQFDAKSGERGTCRKEAEDLRALAEQ
jgi:hypothetical protein